MINLLRDRLSKAPISGWQIREVKQVSFQSFLAQTELECIRKVESTRYDVTVLLRHSQELGKEVLGLSSFRLGLAGTEAVDQKIAEAMISARLVSNEPFDLVEPPPSYPDVEIEQKGLNEKMLDELHERLIQTIHKEKKVRLSSAEFFLDAFETTLLNHKGLFVQQRETVLQTEFILLSKNGHKENEHIDRYSRRLLKDFDLESEVKECAEFARNATVAVTPRTGLYPVLMSGEPLDHLFNPLLARSSARLKYNNMLEVNVGKPITLPGMPSGDTITLWSRSLLPGALGSNRFDSYGTPAQDVKLIDKSKVVALLADQRYGSYLNIPVTGELGNIEIEAGTHSFSQLISDALTQFGALIHLQAFSAFEPNPITGAYSAEIRAGLMMTPQGCQPIKGGSVSGLLQKDLLNFYLSSERTLRERILCPKGILFKQLSIAGE